MTRVEQLQAMRDAFLCRVRERELLEVTTEDDRVIITNRDDLGLCAVEFSLDAACAMMLDAIAPVATTSADALKELLLAWEADDLPRWRTALIAARKVVKANG